MNDIVDVETFTVTGGGPAAYERYLVPALFRPLAGATVAAARPLAGRRVLDVACGTGIVARVAANAGAVVTGVDANPAMLAVAQAADPHITWVQGDAAALPMPDKAFDIAFCQQGLQYVPDPGAVLAELRRVLAPGGRLRVALWCDVRRAPGFAAFIDALDRWAGPGVADILRAPFSRGDARPIRRLIAAAGLIDTHATTCVVPVRFPSVSAFFEWQCASSPLAGPMAALPAENRRAILRDMASALADRIDDEGLFFPAECHLFGAVRA